MGRSVDFFLVTVQPDNVEAAQSLRQCMSALKEMQVCKLRFIQRSMLC